MGDLSGKNFGLIIAFLLPGFVVLWGMSLVSPTVTSWISASQQTAPTVGGFFYVTLASLACGLTISAVRWAVVDTLHHRTGISSPNWDFANLDEKLEGFHGLVENHYRYYQFYSNMFVAAALAVTIRIATAETLSHEDIWLIVGVLPLEGILFAGSRDALQKYYRRAERLLGSCFPSSAERKSHDERLRSSQGKADEDRRKKPEGQRKEKRRKARSAK